MRCCRAARAVAMWLLVMLLACGLVGCGSKVPELRGLTPAQAAAALNEAGFKLGAIAYDERGTGAVGAVIAQDPAGSARLQDGAVVNVVVAGAAPVKVPDLTGLEQSAAQAVLANVGLRPGTVVRMDNATIAAGKVTSQTPAPAVETPHGGTVDLVVSDGPAQVKVPTVIGKAEGDAVKRLQAAGFKVEISRDWSSAKAGRVAAIKPAGAALPPGTAVTILVSKGPRPAPAASNAGADRIKGIFYIYDVDFSQGIPGRRTGYGKVEIGGRMILALCPFLDLGERQPVWVAKQGDGTYVITGPR